MTAARSPAPRPRPFRLCEYQFADRRTRCPRCERRLRVRRRYAHWRKLRAAWLLLLLLSLPCVALLGPAVLLLWPFWALFALGIGPLNALAREQPCCSACGIGLGRSPIELRSAHVEQPTRAVVIDLDRHWRTRMRRRRA